MFQMKTITVAVISCGLLAATAAVEAQFTTPVKDGNNYTKANRLSTGGITNTRHNLTQSYVGLGKAAMDQYRNQYNEVCVYCHTPHGTSTNVEAPLWNRSKSTTTYTLYSTLNTTSLSGSVHNPGLNSLTCLSCHDGTVAIDSVINMPGSGGFSAAQMLVNADKTSGDWATSQTFLDSWGSVAGNAGPSPSGKHFVLAGDTGFSNCSNCHANDLSTAGPVGDFNAYFIGTDLRNDHPVGIDFPLSGKNGEFNVPLATRTKGTYGVKWFDSTTTGKVGSMDKNEVRVYKTANDGYKVECASCHDPHGVPKDPAMGPSQMISSFLRVSNSSADFAGQKNSGLCLTCHVK
ncbi:MAG: hypothetical protein AB1810_08575 [Pseudomonadota bacterium]